MAPDITTLRRLYELMHEANRAYEWLVRKFNELIDSTPWWLKEAAIQTAAGVSWVWEKITDVINKFWELLKKCWSNPIQMFNDSNSWSTIQEHVSDRIGYIDLLKTDDRWEGDSGDAYKDLLTTERKAYLAFTEKCSAAASALNWFVGAILVFYAAMAVAIVTLTVALVGACVAAASVIAAIAALPAAAIGAYESWIAAGAAVAAFWGACLKIDSDLSNANSESAAFPGHYWPVREGELKAP